VRVQNAAACYKLSAPGDVELFPIQTDETLLPKSINRFIFSRFLLVFMPWAAAIRLFANLPTTVHYLFITPVFFFCIIHVSIFRVSMTQMILFLLRSRASLLTSLIKLYIKSYSETYFSIS
jgi:hypothetical protein